MSTVKKVTDMGWGQPDALWMYTSLPEPLLSSELERLAFAKRFADTDVVSFQPCPDPDQSNQDRYSVQDWDLPGGVWSFRAVFDGHAGHETADYTVSTLPGLIKAELASVISENQSPPPASISDALSKAISAFDDGIGKALVDLFPDQEQLASLSDAQIRAVINDNGPMSAIVLRCMRGSTVLVSLTDPSHSNLWVASLGDCAAVLGAKDESGKWVTQVLSSAHNGENEEEVAKVRAEHPGELECVKDDRVLGAIAVTRAVGDFTFKLPAVYTHRVFLNSEPGFIIRTKVEDIIVRNLTPPYMSGTPDIRHIDISSSAGQAFLVLCSDGLMDLYEDDRLKLKEVLSPRWGGIVGRRYGEDTNLALALLRDACGGDDLEKVSRTLTVEMGFRWMDDTTIVLHKL